MKSFILVSVISSLVYAQAPAPAKVLGKDLPSVPGPVATRENLPDLVGPIGNSGMELGIRRSARRGGFVPALAVPAGDTEIAHMVNSQAGWQAYRVEVAPGEKVHARLRGDHEAWFVVRCVNRMGLIERGMLQNRIHTGNPEASYINPKQEAVTVFFVVDTSETSALGEAYTLTILHLKPEAK